MAGRKQHYIPRSFLRGFLSHRSSDRDYVWVFPKGRAAYNPEISGVASERHFYSELSKNGEETLDTKITDYESGRFLSLLHELRRSQPGAGVDSAIVAEVICHLIIRNAGLRDALADGLKGVVAKVFSTFTREGALRDFLGLDKSEPDRRFQEIMRKVIAGDENLKKLGLPDDLLTRVAFFLAKEAGFRDLEIGPIKSRLAAMYHQAEPFTRNSHNKFLVEELIPKGWLSSLTPLRWEVVSQPNLILPDCVAIGFKDNVSPEPLATMGDSFVTVAMPLTKDVLLVGQREGAPRFFPGLFNLCAAACSHDFFMAAAKIPEIQELTERIGIWSRKSMYEALAALEEKYPSASVKLTEPKREEIAKPVMRGSPLEYQFTFSGWPNEETPLLVVEKTKPLVSYMAEKHSLVLLDGITFAMDYENVLATMDRGYVAPPVRTTSVQYGVGWSLPVDVLRDGIHKVRLVFRGDVGQLLLANDHAGRRMAEQMVVFQLANVAFNGMVGAAFADNPLPQSERWIDTLCNELMGYAVGSYFAARESSTFYLENGTARRELLAGAVEDARKIIMEERLSYRFHGDLQKFLIVVHRQVTPILKFAAELAGHMDGTGAPNAADVELKKLLGRVNLGTWFDQFRIDLRLQLNEKRRWASAEAFQEINYHAERVLWAFGVFPWTTSDGRNRVEIPLILDAARLRQAILHRPLSFARVLFRTLRGKLWRFLKGK